MQVLLTVKTLNRQWAESLATGHRTVISNEENRCGEAPHHELKRSRHHEGDEDTVVLRAPKGKREIWNW